MYFRVEEIRLCNFGEMNNNVDVMAAKSLSKRNNVNEF